jgi:hypothetical protein
MANPKVCPHLPFYSSHVKQTKITEDTADETSAPTGHDLADSESERAQN